MRSRYTADDIMEVACDQYCVWLQKCSNEEIDEDIFEEHCEHCKLDAMIRTVVSNF